MRPEVLAPAGDEECLQAAVRSGADAVYFGVQGFNARARATNFSLDELPRVLGELHAAGVKGYLTLNTLVFDHELGDVERTLRAAAGAGADAVIVQDLGVLRLARAVAPTLPVHASTQMTCTDAASIALAASLGAARVVVARELSLDDLAAIRAATDVELEVFVHGALCVSYSGQCLTSEAIGGRSANRGACAQACRLPYELVVDGALRELGDVAHLLSPQDLEASALVPELARLGVASLKIEGRLKGPSYVAAAVRLYRAAVDALDADDDAARPLDQRRRDAVQCYSRGSGPGFLRGVDHQRLVEGRTCEHRGLVLGELQRVVRARGRCWLELATSEPVARGDGLFIEGGRAGDGERGGRVWDVVTEGTCTQLWLGPDVDVEHLGAGRRVFKNDDPALDKRLRAELDRDRWRERVDVTVRGRAGEPLVLEATSARGLHAQVESDTALAVAHTRPLDEATLADKLGKLGDTPYRLGALDVRLEGAVTLPLSSLNRARRALAEALALSGARAWPTTSTCAGDLLTCPSPAARVPDAGLFVPILMALCRSLTQARAALAAGADGVYLDLLALTGTGAAVRALRAEGARVVGVALPRVQKPGEQKIGAFLRGLSPDALLVRSLGALAELPPRAHEGARPLLVGDFSLNAANHLAAAMLLERLDVVTPSYDLDERQLAALLTGGLGPQLELPLHQPLPLFHTEHCLFAALLSSGSDHTSCGRPCERHVVSLRDRIGLELPVEADVGCRNTVFHARAQSAAALVGRAQAARVRRFRVELVREPDAEVTRIVRGYRALLDGTIDARALARQLGGPTGVVKGSLRVLEEAR
ncbi:MAG: U32 family peptidase [Deltaproteobacteria bacterium]|nr:U32 family peptidase [Deltaproteobacteria bacterium]